MILRNQLKMLTAAALGLLVLSLAPTASAQPDQDLTPAPPLPEESIATWNGETLTVDRSKIPQMRNAREVMTSGERSKEGSCKIADPKLTLAPGEDYIGAQTIELNTRTCTATWLVGVPEKLSEFNPPEGDPTADTEKLAKDVKAAASAGYYKAWKVDIINITLNSVASSIAWAWDGNCVLGHGGMPEWYAQMNTGWIYGMPQTSFGGGGCPSRWQTSYTHYFNPVFCFPSTGTTVYAHYSDVIVFGGAQGQLSGNGTSWHYGNCLPLIDRRALVRTMN
jgi:hypothetical protein